MRLRRPVRVVGFVGMREDAVDERGIHRSGQRRSSPTTVATGRPACARASASAARPGGSSEPETIAAKRIEDVMLGLLDDVGRQRAVLRRGHVGAERGHHRADALRPGAERGQRGRAECERAASEQTSGGRGGGEAAASCLNPRGTRESRYGSANTTTCAAPVSPVNSGVTRRDAAATSEGPVVTATYCLPATANDTG